MAFVTDEQLRIRSNRIDAGFEKLAKSLLQKDLFLSHSKLDSSLIPGALDLLSKRGASVYVDVTDPEISSLSMAGKVDRVKDAIRQCKKLVILFTKNSESSRWIPWELGLAEGIHGVKQVATFPVGLNGIDEEAKWGKQEYFASYPQIVFRSFANNTTPDYLVLDPADNQAWTLKEWFGIT